MIDYLIGEVFRKNAISTTILTNGSVGYEVFIPLCYNNYKVKDILNLDIVHIQKEDGRETLYGFFDAPSKLFFNSLLTVDGIGDKKAFSILAKNTPIELMDMVNSKDLNAFKKVKGVGPKTAEKIIETLAGKIEFEEDKSLFNDAREALLTLGVSSKEIDSFIDSLDKTQDYSINDLIKLALARN